MKKLILFFITTLFLFILSGCTIGDANLQENITITPTPVITVVPTQISVEIQSDETPTPTPSEPTAEPTPEPTPTEEYITATGTYVGLIDNNSFEAVINDVPMAFRHENCADFIESAGINDGDSVEIVYYVNEHGQNIAVSISLVKSQDNSLNLADYFPIRDNVYKQYHGEGNEYAAYSSTVQFTSDNKIQYKIDNGGTCTVNVYLIDNDSVIKTFMQSEIYDDISFLDSTNRNEIILKMPLEVGTTWDVNDTWQRSITSMDKAITTPYASFTAIEVTTTTECITMYDYYVKDLGHVKSVYHDNNTNDIITSSLEAMTIN